MTEALITLITGSAILLGSPGPATLSLAAVGATFGFKRGAPFLLGLLGGAIVAIMCAMAGIAVIFSAYPPLKWLLQAIGGLYIGYLAYKVASAPTVQEADASDTNTPRFRDGFILNLINPKAYAVFLSMFSQFMLPHDNTLISYGLTALSCYLVLVTVDVIWLAVGGLLRPVFARPIQARVIRIIFAISMLTAIIYATLPQL